MKKIHLIMVVILSFNSLMIHSKHDVTLHKRFDNYNKWERPVVTDNKNLTGRDRITAALLYQQLSLINMSLHQSLLKKLDNNGNTFDYCDINLWGDIEQGLSGHITLVTKTFDYISLLQHLLDELVFRLDTEHKVKNVSYQIDIVE